MNALARARLDDPLVGSKHALRRSETLCTLASGLTSLQPSNDVGETSPSYDELVSGSLFWTQKDPVRFGGGQENIYVYSWDDPINGGDPSGKGDPGQCNSNPLPCCTGNDPPGTDCQICWTPQVFCPNSGSGGCNKGQKRCSYSCDTGEQCEKSIACGPGNWDPPCPSSAWCSSFQ